MLTPAQQNTLRLAVQAEPAFQGLPPNGDSAFIVAANFNQLASPAFIVWKTNVSVDEIMRNGIDWARVDNLSVGKARIWDWMGRLGTFDASRPNIRAGIDATWVGTAADLAVRAQVYTHCKRQATKAERLLATGLGTDPSPGTMTFEGELSFQDVVTTMGW